MSDISAVNRKPHVTLPPFPRTLSLPERAFSGAESKTVRPRFVTRNKNIYRNYEPLHGRSRNFPLGILLPVAREVI